MMIAGFGKTGEDNKRSEIKEVATMFGVENDECELWYTKFLPNFKINDRFCAKAADGSDACSGKTKSSGIDLCLEYKSLL